MNLRTTFLTSIVAILAGFANTSPVFAQTMAIPKQADCAKWLLIHNELWAKTMVQGFLSGMSLAYWVEHEGKEGKRGAPLVDPVGELTNMNEAYQWLDSYCAKNPTDHLTQAITALFFELGRRQIARNGQ
jgi:hypothetical protein